MCVCLGVVETGNYQVCMCVFRRGGDWALPGLVQAAKKFPGAVWECCWDLPSLF